MREKILGPYRLFRELGTGGMATVYLAEVTTPHRDLSPGDHVAVKVLHRHLLTEKNFYERFQLEAETGSRFRHPHVVATLDFGMSGVDKGKGHPYIVMEYVEGQSLRDLLQELVRIPENLCRQIGREVATALGAMHAEGIIHRDIKPENLLLTDDNVVKVMDLGVAYLADARIRLSATGQFVGSLFYAAPEQMQGGGKDIDSRVDQYQLGLVLYELASGSHPYKAENVRESIRRLLSDDPRPLSTRNPQISPFFEEVVRTLMAKAREERFPDAAAVAEVFTQGEECEWWADRSQEIRALTRRPLRRIRIARETALHGRDEEMERLKSLWNLARSGSGRAVLVTGEAGIGKTRLVDQFQEDLVKEDLEVQFLYGAYHPGRAATAEGAFSTAFRDHFGARNLEDTLARRIESAPLLVPAFAALLKGEPLPPGAAPLDSESIRGLFLDLTRALGTEHPTMVLIEDLHNAPPEVLELFHTVASGIAGSRVMLLGTARSGLEESWIARFEREEHAHRITLPRLREADLRALLLDALGSERLAQALYNRVSEKSDGKPFYIFEILRGLREGQFIGKSGDGSYVTSRQIKGLKVPSTVKDLVMSRIAGIEKPERRLLELASCCGFEFDPLVLAEAMGIDPVSLLKRLGMIEKERGIVRSAGTSYRFDDHPIQETLYTGLSDITRRRFHSAVARAIEMKEASSTNPRDMKGTVAVDLCLHSLEGGDAEKAVRYFYAALNHLTRGYLNGPAVELMGKALEMKGVLKGPRRIDILLRRALHQDLLGYRKEELETLREALALADQESIPLLQARTRRYLGDFLRRGAEYEPARKVLREGLGHARLAGDRAEEASIEAQLGLVSWREGSYSEARENFEQAMKLARDLSDQGMESRYSGSLGLIEFSLGRYEEAKKHHEEFLEYARESGDRRNEALHTGYIADILWALGRYAESLRQHEKALEISRGIGDRRGAATSLLAFGLLWPELGQLQKGTQHLAEAKSIFRQTHFKVGAAAARHGLGVIAEAEGRFLEAEELYREALETRRQIGNRIGVAESLVALGRLHALMERPGTASEEFLEALSLSRQMDWPNVLVLSLSYLALLSRGDVEFACQVLETQSKRLCHQSRMEANFVLYQVMQEPVYLQTAHDLLQGLLENSPSEVRMGMCDDVPLHRDILSAAGTKL